MDDLSSDAFINALRCLIAIHGNVRPFHSDQGTNYVGAKNELAELMKELDPERVKKFKGCTFVMSPPASSHMSGVWEWQIRSVRNVFGINSG